MTRFISPILLLFFFLFLFSCKSDEAKRIELTFIETLDNDALSFWGICADIQYDEGLYYLLQREPPTLITLDNDFRLINTLGTQGRGPQENMAMHQLCVTDDHLYIYDNILWRIDQYDKSSFSHMRTLTLPSDYVLPYKGLHVFEDNHMLVFRMQDNQMELGVFDVSEQTFEPFSGFGSQRRNTFFASMITDDLIALLSMYSPIIELFSLEQKTHIATIDVMPKILVTSWENMKTETNSPYVPFFMDAYGTDNKLFAVYQNFDLRQGPEILSLTFKNNKVQEKAFLHRASIETPGFETICVEDNVIFSSSILRSLSTYTWTE